MITTHLGRLCVGVLVLSPFLCLVPVSAYRHGCQIFRRDLMYFTRNDQGLNFLQTEGDWLNDPTEVGLPIDTPFFQARGWTGWQPKWFGIQKALNRTLTISSPTGVADPSTFTQPELDTIYAQYSAHLTRVGFDQRTSTQFLKGPGVTTRLDLDTAGAALVTITLALSILYTIGWVVSSGVAESLNRSDSNVDPETGRYIRCPACKYDLAGLTTDICPECGRRNPSRQAINERARP